MPRCTGTARRATPHDGKPGVILDAEPGLSTGACAEPCLPATMTERSGRTKRRFYQGPYGYSDIAVLPNGKVACVFELNKQDLLFTVFDAPPTTSPE